jgi:peptide deformylase
MEDARSRLRLFPDSALRLPSRDVTAFDSSLEDLISAMVETLTVYNGAGLAANQIGVLQRVILLRHEDVAYALVNPHLSASSEETDLREESCLSLPGVPVFVERHRAVDVRAYDPKGKLLEFALEGHAARIAQHELDHLDGILISDRTSADEARQVRGALRELVSASLG